VAYYVFVLMYTFLATMRDFRDNFSVEIWNEIQPSWDKSVFSQTEMISGLVVLISVGCLSLIRNNIKGFWAAQWADLLWDIALRRQHTALSISPDSTILVDAVYRHGIVPGLHSYTGSGF